MKGKATKLRGQVRSQVQLGNEGRGAGNEGRQTDNEGGGGRGSVMARVARKLERKRMEKEPPRIDSFADFLTDHAQVKSGSSYIPYHFTGREVLRPIVERLDQILASGEPDVSLALCGGAQFGKTVLMLNLLVYLVAVRFRNVGYYLPDDDLVSGLVDGKLRPDVLDQIPWLARSIAVGKTLNASGRAVNRKGAFLCTDGKRTALAFMRGLGKIPTSFSMDVVIQDEKDDLPEEHARFLAGRMTASNLRLSLIIGTQRYHGAGQNLAFTEGTQHVGLLTCPRCGRKHNPETAWPEICRLVREDLPRAEWPRLTVEGHFCFSGSLPAASCARSAPGQQVVRATEEGFPAASCAGSAPGQQVVRATEEGLRAASCVGSAPGQQVVRATEEGLRAASCAGSAPGQQVVRATEERLRAASCAGSAPGQQVVRATEEGLRAASCAGSAPGQQVVRATEEGLRAASCAGSAPGRQVVRATEEGLRAASCARSAPGQQVVRATEEGLRAASCARSAPGQQVVRATEEGLRAASCARSAPGQQVVRATEEGLRAASCAGSAPGQQVVRATEEGFPVAYAPGQRFVLACPECGEALDREHPVWHAQAPEREALRKWSYRISQLLIPDIDLAQIVSAWQLAIRDPDQMTVFCTDRLALPKSTSQTLTPHDLQAARENYQLPSVLSAPLDLSTSLRFGGLDMGDQCWFVARTVELKPPHQVRLLWIEPIAAERVRIRVPELFHQLNLNILCVDAGPLRDLSRDLVFMLNHLDETSIPSSSDGTSNIFFSGSDRTPGGGLGDSSLSWHAASEKWKNLRCAAVEFTQREGQGLRHKIARTQSGRLYPLIAAHRDETIQRVITELLPANETRPRLQEKADGTAELLPGPRFLLPTPTEESREGLSLYERHLLAGARQERSPDGRTLRYLDKCENHFLLATAYAALAELLAPGRAGTETVMPGFRAVPSLRGMMRRERSVVG